jgi:hypothetical protein
MQQEFAVLVHDVDQTIGHAPNQLFRQFDVECSGTVRVGHVGCELLTGYRIAVRSEDASPLGVISSLS